VGCYLVTGAAGFIGAALAARLLSEGHEVVAIDNLSTGNRANLPAGVEFHQADCQDGSLYDRLPRRAYEAIYHIAGQSSGEISFDNPVYDLQTNTQSTLLLLRHALDLGCRRVYYASTMSVYGDQPDAPVAETAVPAPRSFYGVGKLASEHYLRIYSQYGIDAVALRLFNVYGPGQNMANLRQGMASIYLAQALSEGAIHVKGGGDRFRDFVYIDDVVAAFLALRKRQEAGYAVFNVATGIRTRVRELVDLIRDRLPGRDIPVTYAGSTPGDMFGIVADCTAAFESLGWRAEVNLAEGLGRMTQWALARS
jgi:UDP-glucose 4-epimerase